MSKKLTDKQERFSFNIACGHNAAEAARRAGYGEKSARQTGYNLLQLEHIQNRIKEYRELALNTEDIASAHELMEFFTRVIKGEVTDHVVTPTGKIIEKQPSVDARLKAAQELLKRYPDAYRQAKTERLKKEAERDFGGVEIRLTGDLKELLADENDPS